MAEQFKNLAGTTLNGAIDDQVTTITVASAMGFTGGDFRILVDSEIMKVTAVSGLDLTVARGQEGTDSTAHSNGAAVAHVLTKVPWTPTTRTIWRPTPPMPVGRRPAHPAASFYRPTACSSSATTARRGRSSARSGP